MIDLITQYFDFALSDGNTLTGWLMILLPILLILVIISILIIKLYTYFIRNKIKKLFNYISPKFWFCMEIADTGLILIFLPIGILSFIIGIIIWIITGLENNIFISILEVIINYVAPIWCIIWVINGMHAIDYLITKE